MKKIIKFNFEHGNIEGAYLKARKEKAPLVIITNGHNGFYNYGMFPYIQEKLQEVGISSYSYNFSHGGIIDGKDYFEDLAGYEKNCMRLETEDLVSVVRALPKSDIEFSNETDLYFFTHSLGGIPTLFATKQLSENDNINPKGIILLSSIKTLDVWPEEMIQKWENDKVYYMKNSRTGQELPQGYEFLTEIKESNTTWNVEKVIKKNKSDLLILHGEEDTDVPKEHSKSINKWALEAGLNTQLNVIEGAGHTYNTSHPFEGTSDQLNEVITITSNWIIDNQSN